MKNFFLVLTCYNENKVTSKYYVNYKEKSQNSGLGNVLFQISSGLYYAHKNNATLYIPSINVYLKNEDLKKEDSIFKFINIKKIKEYDERKVNKLRFVGQNIFDIKFTNNLILRGYFENIHNFHPFRNTILNYFRVPTIIKLQLLKKYPILKLNNLCSIHIRRGKDLSRKDYIEKSNFQINEVLKLLDFIIKEKKMNNFFVFTNDKKFTINLLSPDKYKNIKFHYSNERDYIDLWLMSLIKNNIVSRSSFSWWGSYLNEHKDKFIIYSKKNYEDKQGKENYLPPEWISWEE